MKINQKKIIAFCVNSVKKKQIIEIKTNSSFVHVVAFDISGELLRSTSVQFNFDISIAMIFLAVRL